MSANASLHIDKRFTSLELMGGKFCDIGNDNIRPDLFVYGGAHIGATSVFDGLVVARQDLTVEGNLTVLHNIYLSNIYGTEIVIDSIMTDHIFATGPCLDIQGNVCVSGTLSYVPNAPSVWAPPAPSSVQNALDRLANQVYVLSSNTPIP